MLNHQKNLVKLKKQKMVSKILKKLDWIWDYYFVYFMYNGNKLNKYNDYMKNKWENYVK